MRYEDYTSPAALAALLRGLGFIAAQQLAACSRKSLLEAVAALDGILKTHSATLHDLFEQLKVCLCVICPILARLTDCTDVNTGT